MTETNTNWEPTEEPDLGFGDHANEQIAWTENNPVKLHYQNLWLVRFTNYDQLFEVIEKLSLFGMYTNVFHAQIVVLPDHHVGSVVRGKKVSYFHPGLALISFEKHTLKPSGEKFQPGITLT